MAFGRVIGHVVVFDRWRLPTNLPDEQYREEVRTLGSIQIDVQHQHLDVLHELQGVPLRETRVNSVALRVEQIAVCVDGLLLTQALLLAQESLRSRWHIVNVHRDQIACSTALNAPELVLQARSPANHFRSTVSSDLSGAFAAKTPSLPSSPVGCPTVPGKILPESRVGQAWTYDHAASLPHTSAGLPSHLERHHTRKSDTLTTHRHLSAVAHFTLGHSRTFSTPLMSKWSSSNTLKPSPMGFREPLVESLETCLELTSHVCLRLTQCGGSCCRCCLSPRTLAGFVPVTSGSTFSSSQHVVTLTAVLAQSFEHTSCSVPAQRAVFRHPSRVQQVSTFMHSFASSFFHPGFCDISCRGARSLSTQGSTQRESPRFSSPTLQDEVKSTAPYSRVPKSLPENLWFRSRNDELRYHARTPDWTDLFLDLSHDRQ